MDNDIWINGNGKMGSIKAAGNMGCALLETWLCCPRRMTQRKHRKQRHCGAEKSVSPRFGRGMQQNYHVGIGIVPKERDMLPGRWIKKAP